MVRTRSRVPAGIRTAARADCAGLVFRVEKVTDATSSIGTWRDSPWDVRKSIWRALAPTRVPSVFFPLRNATVSALSSTVYVAIKIKAKKHWRLMDDYLGASMTGSCDEICK